MPTDRIIFKSLLKDLAKECKLDRYNAEEPDEKHIDRLISAIYNKISLYPKDYLPKSAEGISKYVRNIKGREPINFNNEKNKHRGFALAFYLITRPKQHDPEVWSDFIKQKNFVGFWEEYKDELLSRNIEKDTEESIPVPNDTATDYIQMAHQESTTTLNSERKYFSGLEIINDEFWKRHSIPNRIAAQFALFLEDADSRWVPDLLANEFLNPSPISDKVLNLCTALNITEQSLPRFMESVKGQAVGIKLTSSRQGEGKTTYLWHLAKRVCKEWSCIWISDLSKAQIFDAINSLERDKPILLIIDGQLHHLNSDARLLDWNAFELNAALDGRSLIAILSDSEYNFSNFKKNWESFSLAFDIDYSITDFLFNSSESSAILKNIIKNHKLDINHLVEYEFTAEDKITKMNLRGRTQQVLNQQNKIIPLDWQVWIEDPLIKEFGLVDVYCFITALKCYNIKFPIDYYSPTFFKGSKQMEFLLLETHSKNKNIMEFAEIVHKPEYPNPEYPTSFVNLKNIEEAKHYIHSNDKYSKLANQFYKELIQIIKGGKSQNCHAYVFRKFYSYYGDKRFESLFKTEMGKDKPIEILDLLVNSADVDLVNKAKCQHVKSRLLTDADDTEGSEEVLETLGGDLQKFQHAKNLEKKGLYKESLEILDSLPNLKNYDYVRYQCFINLPEEKNLETAFRHYMALLRENKHKDHNVHNMFACIYTLERNLRHNIAKDYLHNIMEICKAYNYQDLLSKTYFSLAKIYVSWAQKEKSRGKPYEKKLTFAEKWFKDARRRDYLHTRQCLVLSDIYQVKGDVSSALSALEEEIRAYPYTIILNAEYASILIDRPGNSNDKEVDYETAEFYLSVNFQTFDMNVTKYEQRIKTYILQSKLYELRNSRYDAFKFLKDFIDFWNIPRNYSNPSYRAIHMRLKDLEV